MMLAHVNLGRKVVQADAFADVRLNVVNYIGGQLAAHYRKFRFGAWFKEKTADQYQRVYQRAFYQYIHSEFIRG
jgi:hypothetical protein